jgi:hypothetical protein
MGNPASVPLPINVAPQQTVDLSVDMTAPDAAGHYEGLWRLQTADGTVFGVGDPAKDNLWVRISAIAPAFSTPTATAEPPTSTFTAGPATATVTLTASASATATTESTAAPQMPYSFAANPCEAQWQSNMGVLECPGKEGDAKGFVLPMERAQLEDGTTASLPSLLTFPHASSDGYILGVFPEYQVQAGDHFQASVGCEKDATACSVLFRLSYLDASSTPHDLWTLGEFYDGKVFNLDFDLSGLVGQKVKFVLDVSSLGDATGDRALWVDPHIMRFAVPTATITDTPTAVPSSTPTLVPTATAPATLTPTPLVLPTAAVPAPAQPSSVQQVFNSIISFFQQLLGAR